MPLFRSCAPPPGDVCISAIRASDVLMTDRTRLWKIHATAVHAATPRERSDRNDPDRCLWNAHTVSAHVWQRSCRCSSCAFISSVFPEALDNSVGPFSTSRTSLATRRPLVVLNGPVVVLDGPAVVLDGPAVVLDGPAVVLDGPL